MELTTQEKATLKLVLEKELEHVKKDAKSLFISNSDFLTKMGQHEHDLEFLKAEEQYAELLETILGKLQ